MTHFHEKKVSFLCDRSRKAELVIYRCSSLKMERHSLWSISCIISDRESDVGLSWSSTASTCFARYSHTLRPKTSKVLCDVGQEGRRSVEYTLWRIQIRCTLLFTRVDRPVSLKVDRFSRTIWMKNNGNTCITCKLLYTGWRSCLLVKIGFFWSVWNPDIGHESLNQAGFWRLPHLGNVLYWWVFDTSGHVRASEHPDVKLGCQKKKKIATP